MLIWLQTVVVVVVVVVVIVVLGVLVVVVAPSVYLYVCADMIEHVQICYVWPT